VIITRTPFRVSFFGGGTDYPAWYKEHGGAVLATTIDKYCYLSCRYLPPFFDARYRTVYNKTELTKTIAEIEHPVVRTCLNNMDFSAHGTEIVHYADLPSRTGLGSSSSFTVGLLHALSGLKGQMLSKRQLAEMAIDIEQNKLAENVGSQDQVSAAFGGFNLIQFQESGFEIRPLTFSAERMHELEGSLMLVFTGISRFASEVAAHQVQNISKKAPELSAMRKMVDEAIGILTSSQDMADFGRLLHEAWTLKASLSPYVSSSEIDELYARARNAGALGGKLLGAGGGGFMLFYVKPERQAAVKKALEGYLQVPFRFESMGTQVIHFNHQRLI
jgi:D-glycero-alpha-D-manno-heptose-7-phosphate kinase